MTLKELIREKGYTQRVLAERIGVAPSTVSNWCNDYCSPIYEHICKISSILNVPKIVVISCLDEREENTKTGDTELVSPILNPVDTDNLTAIKVMVESAITIADDLHNGFFAGEEAPHPYEYKSAKNRLAAINHLLFDIDAELHRLSSARIRKGEKSNE